MKKVQRKLFFIALSLLGIGCGGYGGDVEPYDYVTPHVPRPDYKEDHDYQEATWADIESGKYKPEEWITFEGYVYPMRDDSYEANEHVTFGMHESKDPFTPFGIEISSKNPEGNGINHIQELPQLFTSFDLRLVCADSTIVKPGDKVRIYGNVISTGAKTTKVVMYVVEAVEWAK